MQFIQPVCNTIFEIPLAYIPVKAGFPSPAEDYISEKIDLNKHVIKHPSATFFVRVSGDSLKDKGVYSGDLVVVDRSLEPKDGNIIIAHLNSEFTIKIFKRLNNKIILKAANKDFPDINIKESDDFEIWGVVTNILRDV